MDRRRKLAAGFDRLLTVCGAVAGFAVAALAVFITLDVILRNIGIASFPWLLEVAEYVLFIATFLAAPWVLRLGSHVRVDLIFAVLPPRACYIVELIADVFGLAVSAILGWYALRITVESYLRGDFIYKELVVAEWLLLMVIPFGCALMAIEFIRRFIAAIEAGPIDHKRGTLTEGF